MFDKIIYISDNGCNIKLKSNGEVTMNLMNLHLVFEDSEKKVLGEVDDLDGDIVKARFLGEIVGNRLIGGTIRKPTLDAKIRVIDKSEIPLITGTNTQGYMELGESPFYDGTTVYLDVNNFFSNHFAIFGNTGSGKSCGTTRLFQNMFHDQRLFPYKANIVIFDSSGEYYSAFSNLNEINPKYNYRFISTNEVEGIGEKLRLPIYLLNKDDLALLLQCTSHSQLPIIERMLKLALVFSQNDVDSNGYKNHLIAKAIMTILYTNETAPNKRNEIFSILASCSTPEFNLEAPVRGIGYVRKFRECFLIDNSGNFTESVLLTEYVNSFIKEEYDSYEPHTGVYYDLNTLEKALNFTLISEGWLRNSQTYGDSVTIRVRLHSLIVGDNAKYFDVPDYMSVESFLSSLLINDGKKYQIVNINLNDIDDDFAKVLTKIYSRLIFDFCKGLKDRGSIPFHLVLEEAHRYIQADHDRFLFGYNIFERIAKEGRKYGVILGIITQRPVELSDNVISQCTNFLIFKINHPVDVEYIRKMVPNITDEIIEKQKSLQSGTCLGFGLGFKIPLIVRMKMPNPSPLSGNCDVVNIWNGSGSTTVTPPEPTPEVHEGISLGSNSASIPVDVSTSNEIQVTTPSQDALANVSSISASVAPVEEPKQQTTEISSAPSISPTDDEVEKPLDLSFNEPVISTSQDSTQNVSAQSSSDNNGFADIFGGSNPSSAATTVESPSVEQPKVEEKPSIIEASFADNVSSQSENKASESGLNSNGNIMASAGPITPISEIAEVNINSQGMQTIDEPNKNVVGNMGEPLLELIDDDDDDDDLGPDFS